MLHLARKPFEEGSILGPMVAIVSCLSNLTDIFIHVDEPEEDPPEVIPPPSAAAWKHQFYAVAIVLFFFLQRC